MKQYIKALFLSATLLGTASCGDEWLNLKPSDELPTEDAVTNYKDAVTALNGIYDGLQEDENYYGARMLYYGDVRGDDMQSHTNGNRSLSLYEMRYTADDAPQIWETPYDVIRRSNNVIAAINAGKVTDGTTENVNDIKGQALAVRALAHFDLVRVYALPYGVDNGAGYGVPVVTEPVDASYMPARNTVAEVYEQIIADFKEAITLLKADKNLGYINKWAAQALLSRVYLYQGDNQRALELAADVIDNSPYKLWSTSEYVESWAKGGNSELLFEIVNKSSDDWVDRESIGYLMAETGYSDLVLTETFLNLIYKDEADVRLGVTLKSVSDKNEQSKKTLFLNKFPGREDISPVDNRINNIPVIRLSEVYLNAAEAAVKLGQSAVADEYLNSIVLRANPAAAAVSGATLERVLEERRKELVGEGHRFFDLMRNNLSVVRYASEAEKGWHHTLSSESAQFNNTYFRAILPIPKKECDANPVIAAQQNKGY